MSITLTERPFTYDFARNSLAANFICTPNTISGTKFYKQFYFTSFPALRKKITFSFGDTDITFIVAPEFFAERTYNYIATASTPAEILAAFEDKILYHYTLSQYYDISAEISGDGVILTFSALNVGTEYNLTITTNDLTNHYTVLTGNVDGIDQERLENYNVYCQLLITRYKNSLQEVIRSSEIFLSLSEDSVKLQLDILRSYLDSCDVPNCRDTVAGYALQYALLQYNILYAEVYGSTPAVHQVYKSIDLFALNAKMYEYSRSLNIPDWDAFHPEISISEYPQPRNYGSTNNLTVKSYKGLIQFLYFIYIGSVNQQDPYKVDLLLSDGTVVSEYKTGQISFKKNAITRIPVGFAALGLDAYTDGEIISYTVKFNFTGTETGEVMTFSRTYLLQQKPFFTKEFLLQNKYGVLESFFCDNQLTEKIVEGDKAVMNNSVEIDITNEETQYTARTGYKTKAEMQQLSDAVGKKNNYRIENNKIYAVTILPDTFQIIDEKEDLQSAEFSYVLNTPANDIGVEESETIYLFERETVWNDTRTWGDHITIYFNS